MTDENKRLKEDLALLKKDYGIEVELYDPEEQPCCRRKHREPDESAALINRLNRIEGQIRGIRGMLERDAYCADILTQSAAVSAAMNGFNRALLNAHLRNCVVRDIRAGDDSVVDELTDLLQKLMK